MSKKITKVLSYQGWADQKGTFFMCLKNHIVKQVFFLQKEIGNRFYIKDDTKFLFPIFEKISILNKLKQNFESGPRAAVC